jgi:CRISPR-associated protein Cmr6
LNKLARFDEDKNFLFYKNPKRKNEDKLMIKSSISKKAFDENFREISIRLLNSINAMNIDYEVMRFKTEWKLALGLGEESVYEVSMLLHHIYGIPYIPGQALKETARNWCIKRYFNNEKEALNDEGFRMLFGNPKISSNIKEHEGNVVFFDAFPITCPIIKVDVLNNHYSDYYKTNGQQPPADYLNPNLVPFLTIENTIFQFIIGVHKKDNQEIKSGIFKDNNILLFAKRIMIEALSDNGIGAKTSVGYGYMTQIK